MRSDSEAKTQWGIYARIVEGWIIMRRDLTEILVCPICKGSLMLEIESGEGDEIITGNLQCQNCKEGYPIIEGTPNLLPPNLRKEK